MRRNAASGDITYSPDDMLLFRESPFACWMERLTLENPDHGIAPDTVIQGDRHVFATGRQCVLSSTCGAQGMPWQEFITASGAPPANAPAPRTRGEALHTRSADAMSIAVHASEQQRANATLNAMQQGAGCIANAQLTVGPLSAPVDLLLRVSGASDFGNYLYMPCDTQGHLRRQRAFRLACAADLLSSLQGVLPPQMLVLQEGEPVETLQSADHIVLYREVRKRFLKAQLAFRKHCMPDPTESSHFGRWTRCAQDILKHRAAAALAARGAAVVHALDRAVGKAP
ncbi:MAG: hypothetical protein KDI09_13885 [Halioglobus sp.]|nr:hypothetical protein [Halioglobus sp.]